MVRKAPPVAFNSQNIKAGALVQGSPRLRTGGSATPARGGWGLWVVLPRPAGAGAARLGTTLGGLKGTPSTLGCSLVMRLLWNCWQMQGPKGRDSEWLGHCKYLREMLLYLLERGRCLHMNTRRPQRDGF